MDVYRTTFSDQEIHKIIESQGQHWRGVRDSLCLQLLLYYGIRKGALRNVQYKHFDHQRKRLTIFSKGDKIRQIPIPDEDFWSDLRVLGGESDHYLLCRDEMRWRDGKRKRIMLHDQKMGHNGAHSWWYRCLARAGVVAGGVTSGERMHKARHTAGQRVLDKTKGNLKATQMLLGHARISTTADVYVDWDIDQLEQTMREVLGQGGS